MEEELVKADVLCVGGGIAGLMAAIRAAELGAKVVVAEKGNALHSGRGRAGNDHFETYIPEVHGIDRETFFCICPPYFMWVMVRPGKECPANSHRPLYFIGIPQLSHSFTMSKALANWARKISRLSRTSPFAVRNSSSIKVSLSMPWTSGM